MSESEEWTVQAILGLANVRKYRRGFKMGHYYLTKYENYAECSWQPVADFGSNNIVLTMYKSKLQNTKKKKPFVVDHSTCKICHGDCTLPFLEKTEGVECVTCSKFYHQYCVYLLKSSTIDPDTWKCDACLKKEVEEKVSHNLF